MTENQTAPQAQDQPRVSLGRDLTGVLSTVAMVGLIALVAVLGYIFYSGSSSKVEAVTTELADRGYDSDEIGVSCSIFSGTCDVVVDDTSYEVTVAKSGDSLVVGFPENFPRD